MFWQASRFLAIDFVACEGFPRPQSCSGQCLQIDHGRAIIVWFSPRSEAKTKISSQSRLRAVFVAGLQCTSSQPLCIPIHIHVQYCVDYSTAFQASVTVAAVRHSAAQRSAMQGLELELPPAVPVQSVACGEVPPARGTTWMGTTAHTSLPHCAAPFVAATTPAILRRH